MAFAPCPPLSFYRVACSIKNGKEGIVSILCMALGKQLGQQATKAHAEIFFGKPAAVAVSLTALLLNGLV